MELIDYIDNYIWLVDEAITVYGSYKVINYGMQNLSYIQDKNMHNSSYIQDISRPGVRCGYFHPAHPILPDMQPWVNSRRVPAQP